MMEQRKRKIFIFLAAWLMFAASLCLVGISFGRYSSHAEPADIGFRALEVQYLQLTEWETAKDGSFMKFCVCNSKNSTDFCADDLRFRIQVTATVGFHPETCGVTLNVDGKSYGGYGVSIDTDTIMYEQMGPGTVYEFYNGGANPMTFSLSGGKLSRCDFTLTVTGDADPSLLRLSVIPEP